MRKERRAEKQLRGDRRRFFSTVAMVGSALVLGTSLARASKFAVTPGLSAEFEDAPQTRRGMPLPPPPAEPGDQDKNAPQGADPRMARKAQLAQNEKEFREGMERLHSLTEELWTEVQRTPTKAFLSVAMYKKVEGIEKLAKQLKALAKG